MTGSSPAFQLCERRELILAKPVSCICADPATLEALKTQRPPQNADAIRMLDVVARDENMDPIKARHET